MRLSKFIMIAVLITAAALLYVWQQTEIIKLAYDGQHKSRIYRQVLDKNHVLMYNLAILKSSQSLGQKVFIEDNPKFQIPEAKQVVELKYVAANINFPLKTKKNFLARLFDLGLRAEAKPVK